MYPRLEELVQVEVAHPFHHSLKLICGSSRIEIGRHPLLKPSEERFVPNRRPQCVQRNCSTVIRDLTKQLIGLRQRPTKRRKRGKRTFGDRIQLIETNVVSPQPLRIGRETFVEPNVVPRGRRHCVTKPLMRQFVGEQHVLGVPERTIEI